MWRVVMVACAALLFVPLIMKSRNSQEIPAHTAFRVLSSGRISVKVSGDVQYPGIYEVRANSLASSAIYLAKPLRSMKQPISVKESCLLVNGSAITFTLRPDGSYLLTADKITVPESLTLGIPLDISAMSEADFDLLPGIGPALAKRIVEYRQNNGGNLRVNDLISIVGIGEKKYKKIQHYFQPL